MKLTLLDNYVIFLFMLIVSFIQIPFYNNYDTIRLSIMVLVFLNLEIRQISPLNHDHKLYFV